MKVTVLVPSEEYRNYAGARIRYGRLAPELDRFGIDLSLTDIARLDMAKDGSDALLVSKCHDARALVAAAAAQQRGQLVGVDIFDDYFSQAGDSRLTRFRTWLTQMLQNCDFAFCATRPMSEVIQRYRPGLPTQIINDPGPIVELEQVAHLLRTKLRKTRTEQRLALAWFGIGDNPHFRVGLHDVAAYAGALRSASEAFDVEFTILTNVRALTTEGLTLITSLPVRTRVVEWTESAERELLTQSLACFLPVNAQPFSAAKSLNRAVTALSAGCQVISVGYPLYEELGDLIYRDVGTLIRDLAKGTMKHSEENFAEYRQAMERIASPRREAEGVAKFLKNLTAKESSTKCPIILVQGQSPNGLAHKAVKALKGLSVASPYCANGLGFDVVFRGGPTSLAMYVSDGAAPQLKPNVRERLAASTKIAERRFWFVPVIHETAADTTPDAEEWHNAPLTFQIATYGQSMLKIREMLEAVFGPCRILISENSRLPFSAEL